MNLTYLSKQKCVFSNDCLRLMHFQTNSFDPVVDIQAASKPLWWSFCPRIHYNLYWICIDGWVWVKCTYFPQGTPSLDVCFRKERNPRFKTQWAENRTCWTRCQVKKRSCYSLLGMNWFLHLKSCTKILSQDGSRLLPLVPDSQTL